MIRFDRSYQALAVGVSMLAGFVDAVGFIESSGFFVSFMTGNSTRLAVGAAEWQDAALVAGGIILMFLAGVVAGSLVAAYSRHPRACAVLTFVALLLAIAAGFRLADMLAPAIAFLALAMGAANASIEGRDGAVVGVTYMTGTLVQAGQKIANALCGAGDARWPHHLWLWAGLVAGAIVGARVTLWSASAAYGLAVMLAGLLTIRAAVITRSPG